MGGSTINLSADKVYIAAIGSTGFMDDNAISAKNTDHSDAGDNTVNISGGTVQIIGNIDFSGSTKDGKDIVNLNLSGENSYWYGDLNGDSTDNTANVSLNNKAQWIYDDNSRLQNLKFNGGIINLNDNEIVEIYKNTMVENAGEEYVLGDYRSISQHKSVTIENLTGAGGIFKVDLDWNVNQGVNYGDSSYYSKTGSYYIFIEKVVEAGSLQIFDFDAS